MAKTKKKVPYSDEVESSDESPENLDNLIKEARGESEKETKDNGSKEVCFNPLSLWSMWWHLILLLIMYFDIKLMGVYLFISTARSGTYSWGKGYQSLPVW